MNVYIALKFIIKYQKKTNDEILAYMDAYLKAEKISQEQYNTLYTMIQ